MRILVLGGDGYLGWPTAMHLSDLGHDVAVDDNFARRGYDTEMGVDTLIPIASLDERLSAWTEVSSRTIANDPGDRVDPGLSPTLLDDALIDDMFVAIEEYSERVDPAALGASTIRWGSTGSELPTTGAPA